MVEYSIAICNYNMSDTLEESLRSILTQLNDGFEVVVVDDGSNDGSIEILHRLEREYNCLRVELLEFNPNRNLGQTRNISIKKSHGKYVLTQLDTDDKYGHGIVDFVTVYHQIEMGVDFDFFLKGKNINMAPRSLLLDVPYRDIKRAHDRDLWRRLLARNALIWLEHESFCESIGYDPGRLGEMKNAYQTRKDALRSGVTFPSYVKWLWRNGSIKGSILHTIVGTVAYLQARYEGRHDLPEEFKRKGSLEKAIADNRMTLREIETRYNLTIDPDQLSERGREIFYQ